MTRLWNARRILLPLLLLLAMAGLVLTVARSGPDRRPVAVAGPKLVRVYHRALAQAAVESKWYAGDRITFQWLAEVGIEVDSSGPIPVACTINVYGPYLTAAESQAALPNLLVLLQQPPTDTPDPLLPFPALQANSLYTYLDDNQNREVELDLSTDLISGHYVWIASAAEGAYPSSAIRPQAVVPHPPRLASMPRAPKPTGR